MIDYILLNILVFIVLSGLFYIVAKNHSMPNPVSQGLQGGLLFIIMLNLLMLFVVMWAGIVRDIVSGFGA